MRLVSLLAIATVSLMVAGCGGGGGVGSTPTPPAPSPPSPPPPPPPPSPPNTSLINLTSSESFVNDAASGSANFPKSGSGQTATAAAATVSIAFDLATKGYTITAGGRTQTFLPADIDNAQSNAGVTVFVKRNGSTTDSLTLTKPGTSGRFTYEFVGGGYWQRTVDGSTAVSGNFDAFSYGIVTPAAGVPRTGTAVYSVDLLAAETIPNDVVGLTGQGKLAIDLGSGRIVLRGTIDNPAAFQAGAFSASALLSSTANAFNGTITLTGLGVPDFSGALNGRFFGPAAQEVGAAFGATNAQGNAIAGSIIGRKGSAGGNTDMTALTTDDFFKGDAARLGFEGSPVAPVAVKENGVGAISVFYNSAGATYDLFLNGRSALIRNRDFIATSLDNSYYAGLSITETYAAFSAPTLKYLRTGRSYTQNGLRYTMDDIVFGIVTSDAALPRTGEGGYAVRLTGSIAETGASQVSTFGGQGSLIANFATGAINTEGSVENYFGFPAPPLGSFNGTATISSSANGYTGTMNFSFGGYTGPLRGRFYGPNANETGAVFSLAGTNGNIATGTLTGASDPAIAAGQKGLLELTQTTALSGTGAVFTTTPTVSPSESVGFFSPISVSFDPVAKSYQFINNAQGNVSGVAIFPLPVTDSQRVVAESNDRFDVYRSGQVTTRIFKPGAGNTQLALTYASFADITAAGTDFGGRNATSHYFIPYGVQTAASQMPRFGTGVYNGAAFGFGRVDQVSSNEATVDGTSRFDVDFGLGTINALLTLTGRNPASGATADLGQFNYSGQLGGGVPGGGISSPNFLTRNADGSFQGNMNGLFFGANAAEIGATFTVDKQDLLVPNSPRIQIQGAALAKKGP
jgi:hypothetical protein